VEDLLTPVIANLLGWVNFSDLKYVFTPAVVDASGKVVTPENALYYGQFIQAVFDFFIIAFAVFLLVKGINKMRKKQEEEKPSAPSTTEVLLTEIRDLLKTK
jgi:large conductance mechanosensitive channel